MASSKVIRPFDPWKSPLCTCPQKFSLNPYTGCSHSCTYCYVTYIPSFFLPRRKKNLIPYCEMDLKSIAEGSLISISNSTDPYQPEEEIYRDSRRILEILKGRGLKVLITTKSDLVLRDLDLLKEMSASVMITITTLRQDVAEKLEPKAPSPHRRLLALSKLSQYGIPCGIRIDPIIPGINDDEVGAILSEAKKAGALHVTASTYKARRENLSRLIDSFPILKRRLEELYCEKGRKIGRTLYLDEGLRRKIIEMVKDEATSKGMTFSSCREGMKDLNSSPSCDGSHLTDYAKPSRKESTFLPSTE